MGQQQKNTVARDFIIPLAVAVISGLIVAAIVGDGRFASIPPTVTPPLPVQTSPVTELPPQPLPTTAPTQTEELQEPLQISNLTLSVQSTQGWQDTGIFVSEGNTVTIEFLSGAWTWTADYADFGPMGDPNDTNTCGVRCDAVGPGAELAGKYCPLYDSQIGALVGRFGEGIPFEIGERIEKLVSSPAQTLYLRTNDCDTGLGDNEGQIEVSIDVEP